MNKTHIAIIAAAVLLVVLIVALLLVRRSRRNKLKKMLDDLYVRFTDIKTVPLAFKLNKAQVMARRNEETASAVAEYHGRYEVTEAHINDIQDMLNNVDDSLSSMKYQDALKALGEVDEELKKCEAEVKDIDNFLEEFSKKESEQREYSSKLKEKYRIVKTTINKNSQILSISYDGFVEKLEECERLFSSSEEYMYTNDYVSAQYDLERIEELLDDIKRNANAVPKLIKDTKGVLPLMLDETKRELALTKQRGVYTNHLKIDEKIAEIEMTLNNDIRKLMSAETDGVKANVGNAKDVLNELDEQLEAENRSFKEARETNDKVYEHIQDMEKVENYVRVAYDKDSRRFGLEDLREELRQKRDNVIKYKSQYENINVDLSSCLRPASEILVMAEELDKNVEADMKSLYSYKSAIDKSTDGESRAQSQLTKLQLVVAEVESKLAEYDLPSIDDSYKQDLLRSREYIERIRNLLKEVPLNIPELNALLDEAIDFIYKFYNNINNVVGMGVMVENAIVFGNKFRSTFPEIDRELSKAEFQYLNGEYTKALKTAIACMETLFPDNADEKIMENA
jgi:septation ring formation regulator